MSQSPQSQVRPRSYFILAALLLLIGLGAGLGLSASLGVVRAPVAATTSLAAPVSSGSLESPFVGVVDRALPAVVFIETRKKASASSDDPQDELMRRFFGDGQTRRQQTRPSSGSGFIIDRDGRVLTNNHVVRDAQEITVTLNDKRSFKARVIGTDPETDVAVIQLQGAEDLPVLPLGDSDRLRIGDWAIAIGNPLGELKGSVTVGIVSAQGRSNLNIFGGTPQFQDFIQTDASINFGNSGGPLCNIRGEVIGINTAINPSGQGIGFAIPINLARHVAEQLIASGTVKRSMIGVQLAELTPELADGFGIRGNQGVVIQDVMQGQPADRAGLRRGDVIVEYQGQPVTDLQKFRLKVADTPVGTKVNLVILRDGRRMPISVTLSPRQTDQIAQNAPDANAPESERLAGVRVRDLQSEEKSNLNVESGVMITDVIDGSAADEVGLQTGDVVEEVGGKPVTSSSSFASLIADAKKAGKKHAVLLVKRGDTSSFVPVKISE
jgi:Do/DeqQ family serine protease